MQELGLLTTAEVAQRLGVAVRTVQAWCRAGRFPHAVQVGAGGHGSPWVIPEADLATFQRPPMGRPWPQAEPEGEGDE